MPSQSSWPDNEYVSLAERYEQLRRTSQAMLYLLKSRLDLSDEELRHVLTVVEQKMQRQVYASKPQLLKCSTCRHPIQNTAKCCLYCGAVHLVTRLSANPTSEP